MCCIAKKSFLKITKDKALKELEWPGVVAELKLGRIWVADGPHCWVCGQLLVEDGEVGSKPWSGLEQAKEKCWKTQKVMMEKAPQGAGIDPGKVVSLEVQLRVQI